MDAELGLWELISVRATDGHGSNKPNPGARLFLPTVPVPDSTGTFRLLHCPAGSGTIMVLAPVAVSVGRG